jgi:hypothetical protein
MLIAADNTLSDWERDAFALSQAALELEQARSDAAAMTKALRFNLALWTSIRSLASSNESYLPACLRERLPRLFSSVADITRRSGAAVADSAIDSLIRLDLELSEGLLDGRCEDMAMLRRA